MPKFARWMCLFLFPIAVACADETAVPLVGPDDASLAHAGAAANCFTPEFTVLITPLSAFTHSGEVSGDLDGTVVFEFDIPGSLHFAGATIHNAGFADWTITGGIVPDLEAFQTDFRNLNLAVDRPGSPAGVFENTGSHRAAVDVRKANLRYKGTFDATVSPPEGLHHYRGVICP